MKKDLIKIIIFLFIMIIPVSIWGVGTSTHDENTVVSTSGNATEYKGESDPTAADFDAVKGNTGGNIQTQLNSKEPQMTEAGIPVITSDGRKMITSPTSDELLFMAGVTSGVQTQLNSKEPQMTSAGIPVITAEGRKMITSPTSDELLFMAGVTSGVQTQIDTRAKLGQSNIFNNDQIVSGAVKTTSIETSEPIKENYLTVKKSLPSSLGNVIQSDTISLTDYGSTSSDIWMEYDGRYLWVTVNDNARLKNSLLRIDPLDGTFIQAVEFVEYPPLSYRIDDFIIIGDYLYIIFARYGGGTTRPMAKVNKNTFAYSYLTIDYLGSGVPLASRGEGTEIVFAVCTDIAASNDKLGIINLADDTDSYYTLDIDGYYPWGIATDGDRYKITCPSTPGLIIDFDPDGTPSHTLITMDTGDNYAYSIQWGGSDFYLGYSLTNHSIAKFDPITSTFITKTSFGTTTSEWAPNLKVIGNAVYAALATSPGKVAVVNKDTLEYQIYTLASGQNRPTDIDTDGNDIYVICATDPVQIVRLPYTEPPSNGYVTSKQQSTTTKTVSGTLTVNEVLSGTVYTAHTENTMVLSLPQTATTNTTSQVKDGTPLCFQCITAFGLNINFDDADTPYLNGVALTAGDSIENSSGAIGDFICIKSYADHKWYTWEKQGTWVDGN